ncbi:FAD-linked oxidase [Saccharothrix sp. ALI-22-I]|uniref:FAD-binding oxidoreductase n=1 Tax=Saccharothrix sp. ALI-22-I TaxID=1933778 RepID=UPI00097BCA96|nr:FAD-binding protein [Saccharothrix sp. ALI-22-I]ONI92541.1 FAD-linked oxidase [Saccharothrix sp. ALI-22-I]
MTELSRREFVSRTAATGTAVVGVAALGAGSAPAKGVPVASGLPPMLTVRPADPQYAGLTTGSNTRWVGTPDYIRIVSSADDVVRAVQKAVDSGSKVVVRSGGHCDEDFVHNAEVRVIIDMAGLDHVGYDARRRAFSVGPGATLGRTYQTLYKGWGVAVPGGTCPTVGVGGHIVGGGYGALSRSHGLTVDHLYAVEVVVVGADGRAHKVVATREADDPHRDLWWAHTGGGGGNFGIITNYWLRSPDARGDDPSDLLPRPPTELLVSDVAWSWDSLTEHGFKRLVRNFGGWHERNSAPDSPHLSLFSQLKTQHKAAGGFRMSTQIDANVPDAEARLDAFLAAVNDGTGADYSVNDRSRVPWFYAVKEWFGFVEAAIARWKVKSSYLRKGMPPDQVDALYRQLTRDDYANPFAMVALVGFGGRINATPTDATAVVQRDSVLKLLYVTLWTDRSEDAAHVRWIREAYADVYAATGGVPRSNDVTDGAFINYCDADLADPAINVSGTPWHDLYYGANYPRLQRVKRKYDPNDIFSHSLSVKA